MNEEKLMRFNIQFVLLKQFLAAELISKAEYETIITRLMKDYGVKSNIVI